MPQDNKHQRALKLFAGNEHEQAAKLLTEILIENESAEVWNDWASVRTTGGHLLEALEGFRRAASLEPDNAQVCANLEALTQALQQQRAAAAENMGGMERRSPIRKNAITCFRNENYREATQILQQLLLAGESAEFWCDLGTIHVALGSYVDAELAYRRALELDGNNVLATTNLVLLLEMTGRKAKAVIWIESISETAMRQARGSGRLAMDGPLSRQEILSNLVKAIRMLPEFPPDMPLEMVAALAVNHSDSSYFVGLCRKLLEDVPEKYKMDAWAAIISAAANDHRLNLVPGVILLDQGDYEAAKPLIQVAFDASPFDSYAARLLDRCVNGQAGDEKATDKYLATHFCDFPWKNFEILTDGRAYQCNSGWMSVPMGKIGEETAENLWNSQPAQAVRSSILDGAYHYCNRVHCAKIAGRTLKPRALIQIDKTKGLGAPALRVSVPPKFVKLAYDLTCNLACPQCRSDLIVSSPGKRSRMDTYVPTILEMAKGADFICMNGAGELFGSRHTRDLLQQFTREAYPRLRLHIKSNGLLFDRRAYEQFDLRGRIYHIAISIDAATAATYSIVRFPGDFERLLKNLRFLDDLRLNEGEKFKLDLCFVISGPNYTEMPDFVELARSFHANEVNFSRLSNWGSLTPEAFSKMNIADPVHPEHQGFLKVLEHPELRDPTVKLGSVLSFSAEKSLVT
jgi:Flp pilus assembly protein TadD